MPSQQQEPELVRWRPWPCDECAAGATLLDFLIGRDEASGAVSGGSANEIIDEMVARERQWLLRWVGQCVHTSGHVEMLEKLDEGSEHLVYYAPGGEQVIKLTKPGVFGDLYFLKDGRVHQQCSTPVEYLLRQELIQTHFGFAASACGITAEGQIVSLQKFVKGDPPSQEEVDEFLLAEGIEPVKQSCWLWKKSDPEDEIEYWIGDARADNFVKTAHGIVPIDLRMWALTVPND